MTTPQIYGIFAALSCAVIAGIIFYCIGLRTGKAAGYEQGRSTAKAYWKKIIGSIRTDLNEARDLLDARTREMAALRQSIEQETADHFATLEHMHFTENDREGVIRYLRTALQEETTKRLSSDDWLTLKLAAKQLGIAAHQIARSGTTKTNQAALAQAQINAMAARVKAILDLPLCVYNHQGITDTDLIDWLDENAIVNFDLETAELRFPAYHPTEAGYDTLRDLLRKAMADNEAIDRNHGELLQAAAAQEDAA